MNYAISDVHAHTKTFEEFLEMLGPDDKVYFLGDAIDKGDGSLEVLKHVIKDKRFVFLMGNHEYMLYSWLYYSRIYDTNKESLSDEECEFYKTLSYNAFLDYMMNDGWRTLEAYADEPEEIQDEIFEYLSKLPLQVKININGQDFILAHAQPDLGLGEKVTISQCNLESSIKAKYERIVWEREFFKTYENNIIITGHSIVQSYFGTCMPFSEGRYAPVADKNDWFACVEPGEWYDIDCGLAMRDSGASKLGILRLDDMAIKILSNKDSEVIDEKYFDNSNSFNGLCGKT